jgi:hypothetical protein
MMPPDNLSPAQLFVELSRMPRPYKIVPFPRKKPGTDEPVGYVALVPLDQAETLQATFAAELTIREKLPNAKDGESRGYDIAFGDACAVEQLLRACREPSDVTKPVFPSASAVRTLTADEIAVLFQSYLDARAEVGPIYSAMTDVEAEAWIDRLVVGGKEVGDALSFFSSAATRLLLRTGVDRIRKLETERDSAGWRPESIEGSTTPSDDLEVKVESLGDG